MIDHFDGQIQSLFFAPMLCSARYKQCMLVEENIGKRKLSLVQQSPGILSPGNKCGRDYTPPKVHMENIMEDESEEENASFNE